MIRNRNSGLDTPRGLGFAVGFGHGGLIGTVAWADPDSDRISVILTSVPAPVSKSLVLRPLGDLVSSVSN